MWFNKAHIKHKKILTIPDLEGFVLPHAGTEHAGEILSHTVRFKPRKIFTNVLILYYPARDKPNVRENNIDTYHEYVVPLRVMKYVIKHFWNIHHRIHFHGQNVRETKKIPKINLKNTLVIASVDFSHFLPMVPALSLENCAAHAIMHRYYYPSCISQVDHIETIKMLYKIIPNYWQLQWIGRTRSYEKKGVGYLSFLIRNSPKPKNDIPNGMFITAYDKEMRQRECLGEWFSFTSPWTKEIENQLKEKVLQLARKTSRLTSGEYLDTPITHYTITYLYLDVHNHFIRGWHGIKKNAFYLPDVMLEHTFNNGTWITRNDTVWPRGIRFNMDPTLLKLANKAGLNVKHLTDDDRKYELYSSSEIHHKI